MEQATHVVLPEDISPAPQLLQVNRTPEVQYLLTDALERLLFWIDNDLPPTEDAKVLARQAYHAATGRSL